MPNDDFTCTRGHRGISRKSLPEAELEIMEQSREVIVMVMATIRDRMEGARSGCFGNVLRQGMRLDLEAKEDAGLTSSKELDDVVDDGATWRSQYNAQPPLRRRKLV